MIYVDTSALVKLVIREAETPRLQAWMKSQENASFFSSQLARVELVRAVARVNPSRRDRARDVLGGLALIKVDDEVVQMAEALAPSVLRSFDAVHLATARVVGTEVSAFVTYDARLSEAARTLGLNVVSP